MDTMSLKSRSLRADSPKTITIDGYLTESKLSAPFSGWCRMAGWAIRFTSKEAGIGGTCPTKSTA